MKKLLYGSLIFLNYGIAISLHALNPAQVPVMLGIVFILYELVDMKND